VWEKLFLALARFDPRGTASFRTWALTITRRHLIDRHRRRQTRGVVLPLDGLPAVDPAADEALAAHQRKARLEAALARLPDAQRRAVVSHHLLGLPLHTIALDEGTQTGTIKSRLHRGRARLAQLLGGSR